MKSQSCRSLVRAGLLFLLLSLCLSLTVSTAFAGEAQKGPTAHRDRLYDVAWVDDDTAVAVGYPGKVFRTKDAGKTWEAVSIETTEPVFSVFFLDAKTGWTAGRKGQIFKSTDGGLTWKRQETKCEEHLFDIKFTDANNGIAVGNFGTILLSKDGGTTWSGSILEPMTSAAIYSVHMVNPLVGYLCGEYPVWEAQLKEEVQAATLSSVFKTADGGVTWTRVAMPDTSHIFSISFLDENHGYVVGSKGLFLKTEDGGATWKKLETKTQFHLIDVKALPDGAFAAGNAGTAALYKNGQLTMPDTNVFYWFCASAFNTKGRGLIVGDHGLIMNTDDGGKTWKQ